MPQSAPPPHSTGPSTNAASLLASLDTPAVLVDLAWRVVAGNPSAQRLLKASLFPGCPLTEAVALHGRDGQQVTAAHVAERHELGAVWVEPQGTARTPAGATIAVAFAVRPVAKQFWLVTMRENQAEVQLTRALRDARIEAEVARRSQRARARFLANMSHELRTPLNAIIGYAEMLMEEADEDPGLARARPDLDKIRSSGRHLLGLINDVLDLSKVDAGRMTLSTELVNLNALLIGVGRDVGGLVTAGGNRLAIDLADDLGTVQTDATKLRQCLFNLLGNAAKFTENGVITLSARRLGDMVHIDVADTGIGVQPDQLDRLFDAFVQERSDTAAKYGGTGLGLALVRALITLLGGEVSVRSTPGVGSTFTLTLPNDPPPARDKNAALASVAIATNDRDFAATLTEQLSSNGFIAERVALDLVEGTTAAPDAWIVDVRDDASWPALEAARRSTSAAVIAVGANERDSGRARRLGASAYLSHPVDHGHLCLLLRARLSR